MKFDAYVLKRTKELGLSRTAYLKTFSEKSEISLQTLQNIARGARMGNYPKAQKVSEATDGEVTIQDLCQKE